MPLRKLIYVSDATETFDEASVANLAQQATRTNATLNVTGLLTMRAGAFLQYLEGPEEKVEAVWRRIRKDDRHVIRNSIVYDVDEDQRLFPDWHMRYLSMSDPKADTSLVLEQMFRQVDIPDTDTVHDSLEVFAKKLAADFA